MTTPIDWPLSLKLAANDLDLARELLTRFVGELPASMEKIQEAFASGDTQAKINTVHHIHGASCYCGVPDLRLALKQLESQLNACDEEALITPLYQIVDDAVIDVISAYSTLHVTAPGDYDKATTH